MKDKLINTITKKKSILDTYQSIAICVNQLHNLQSYIIQTSSIFVQTVLIRSEQSITSNQSSTLYSFIMKKKDQLLQIVKKDQIYNMLAYLQPQDLLNLSLASKRYYSTLLSTLSSIKLDQQLHTKHTKNKPNKSKNSKVKVQQPISENIEVQVDKIPLHIFAKNQLKSKDKQGWSKINQLDIANDYLKKKWDSANFIFYRNKVTNQLIYINRAFADPSLNYNKGGFGQDFVNSKLYQHIYSEVQTTEMDFSSMEAILKRQKEVLEKIQLKKEEQLKNSMISYEQELLRAFQIKKIGLILCFGGSFSFGIFQGGKCILHKSDRKYVCRMKAGERQFNRDKQSGSGIQSIGSQIRRDQQKKHMINVGEILREHNKDLAECEIIFLQAPGLNRLFVINQNENLDGLQDRLRSVCVTAKKANFTQVEAVYESISIVNVVHLASERQNQQKMPKTKKKNAKQK